MTRDDNPPVASHGEVEATVMHRVGREVTWSDGEGDRLVYHYATDRRKAYVHPLRSAAGDILTDMDPADHPWHHGLWFAWKYINGHNFWEEAPGGDGDGHTEFAGVDEITWRGGHTRVVTRYEYLDPGGSVLLRETRALDIAAPAAGPVTIDWDATFVADRDVRLDRTAPGPDSPFGGYAGLSFRAAAWEDVESIDSEGRRNLDIKNRRACWVGITGVGCGGRRAGVAMLDHPENPRFPSHWYYGDDRDPLLRFSFLNPSPVYAEPYDLAAGAALRLRYRVLTLAGSPDAAALAAQYAAFVAGLGALPWPR